MITITDGRTDTILDDIDYGDFWNDNHHKSLKDNIETFDFTTFSDKNYSQYLTDKNRIVIPDEDGSFIEFEITNHRKYHGQEGKFIEVYTSASYLSLQKAKVIRPQKLQSTTAKSAAQFALKDTEFEVGEVHYAGIRTINIERHTNPFALLKRIAREFNLELRFRVVKDSNKIVKRYVDLLERVGEWQGREVEFGKDLISIERKEDTSNIVTALIGLGPEREDGTRLEVFVEDKEALERWGRNGQHIVDIYEPQFTDENPSEERLKELTKNELEKRVNALVEYVGYVSDLEKVPGLEHERFRFGDTIKLKDTAFNPPLYMEARVHTQDRPLSDPSRKKVTLGDFIELSEEEVFEVWKALQQQINKAKQDAQNAKQTADGKNTVFYQDTKPSLMGRKEGDLWFKSDEGYKPFRFNGSDFVEAPFGHQAIGSIDLGKATVGELLGKYIAAKTLEAGHIKSLNGLDVGNGQFVVDSSGNVNFGGNLNGATGTFRGSIDTPMLTIGADNIEGYDEFGLRLQTAQWQEDTNNPFIKTGYIVFNTLNNGLEIYRVDENGNYYLLDGIDLEAARVRVSGIFQIHGDTYTAGKMYFENNQAIYHHDTARNYRRTILRGNDDWVHINPDGYGRTKIGSTLEVAGSLNVNGAKNAIHKTKFGTVATPAYEMAESYLGDIGTATTEENGECRILIEEVFKETVNTEIEYHVFLSPYSQGIVWVEERNPDYFVVKSDRPNVKFVWEVKAKRRGYEDDRLEKYDDYDEGNEIENDFQVMPNN